MRWQGEQRDGLLASCYPGEKAGYLLSMPSKGISVQGTTLCSPVYAGNQASLLVDGPATFTAMRQAIEHAQQYIHLEIYIFKDDALGRQIADLLLKKRAEGVRVRIIYDAVGARFTPVAFFARLHANGVELLEYQPLNPLRSRYGWHPNNRDHRKILIVDGRIAFTGGINISSSYTTSAFQKMHKPHFAPEKCAWRDTDIQIRGPAVAGFQRLFLAKWQQYRGMPAEQDLYPEIPAQGDDRVQVLASTARVPENPIHAAYINAIVGARKRVCITNAYFAPDNGIIRVLEQAAQRGVDVKIILSTVSDFNIVLYAGHYYYQRLLTAGVRIFELQKTLLHSKTALVDDDWATVGSYNLDIRSYKLNQEVNAVIWSRTLNHHLNQVAQQDLSNSKEITHKAWAARPFLDVWKEDLSHLAAHWL